MPSTPPHPSTLSPSLSAPLPLTPLNGPLLLLACMVLVSIWATYDIELSLPKLSGMVLGFGTFFAVVREASRTKGWWLSLLFFGAMGFGVAILGFLGTRWTTTKLDFLNPLTNRFPSLFDDLPGAMGGFHPNEVAGALTWVLPILIVFSVYSFSPVKISAWRIWAARSVIWLISLLVGFVFVLTQSRTGYLAVAITFPILLFVSLPRRWRWILLALILVTGLIFGFVVSEEDLFIARDWLMGSGLTTAGAFSLSTLDMRIEIWARAIYGLQDFSFTGMGMNTFRQVVHVIYPLFMVDSEKDLGHAHNEFLQAGLDLGIPGMIAFIALYIGAFWMLADLWKKARGPQPLTPNPQDPNQHPVTFNLQRATILGLGGGLLAHLVYGLTDAIALGAKPGLMFWMLLGLIAGLHNRVFSPVVTGN